MYLLDIGERPGEEYVEFRPAITAADMIRLGTDKLLEFLDMTREGIADLMSDVECATLEDLALFLSDMYRICPYCGADYAHIADGLCYTCKSNILERGD